MTGFSDHFSGHAADYAVFRPHYPPDFIRRLAMASPARDLAWDLGTGNGQAARLLADHFMHVEAMDASAEQVRHAIPHERVSYRVGREDQSGLADESVDLVCAAQAAHWFNHQLFHEEARRVLKPGGLLAVWAYGLATVDPAVDALVLDLYQHRLGRWWPAERRMVDNGYRSLPFPFPEMAADPWVIETRLDLAGYLGYLGTWSALARARQAEGGDPLRETAAGLSSVWPEGESRLVRWPLFLRWGRKGG